MGLAQQPQKFDARSSARETDRRRRLREFARYKYLGTQQVGSWRGRATEFARRKSRLGTRQSKRGARSYYLPHHDTAIGSLDVRRIRISPRDRKLHTHNPTREFAAARQNSQLWALEEPDPARRLPEPKFARRYTLRHSTSRILQEDSSGTLPYQNKVVSIAIASTAWAARAPEQRLTDRNHLPNRPPDQPMECPADLALYRSSTSHLLHLPPTLGESFSPVHKSF